MANKVQISQLPAVSAVGDDDLLVVSQGGVASKATGAEVFANRIDSTLSVAGKAADAAKVGELKSAISEETRNLNTAEMGRYADNANGAIYAGDNTCYGMKTSMPIESGETYVISCGGISSENAIKLNYMTTDENGNVVIRTGFVNANARAITMESAARFLHVYYKSDSVIFLDDAYVQIEKGTAATDYIPPLSAVDAVLRERLEGLDVDRRLSAVECIQLSPVAQIVDVAETYFDVAYDKSKQLLYDTTHGLYSPQITDSSGVQAIVCSQFAQACIAGICYANSRYALGESAENQPLWWGWQSDGTGTYRYPDLNNDYMTAAMLAKYFKSLGVLRPFSPTHNGMKPGAVAFFITNGGTSVDDVGHVGIILRAYRDSYTMMHSNDNHARICDGKEAGVYIHDSLYSSLMPTFYVNVEDLHIPISSAKTALLAKKTFDISGSIATQGETAFIGTLRFEAEPLPRGFYTVNVDMAGDCEVYFKIYYDAASVDPGITVPNLYCYPQNQAGMTSAVMYAELPIQRIEIRAENGVNYSVGTVCVYRGYHSPEN